MTHNHPRLRREGTPTADEILDALFALVAACNMGHIRWEEGTRGHREAGHAIKQAREVLLRSKWRALTTELRTPATAEYQSRMPGELGEPTKPEREAQP